MNNKTKINHQDTRKLTSDVSDEKYGATLDFAKNHVMSAIVGDYSNYSIKTFEQPVKVSLRTLIGFKSLSFAVCMIVIIIYTLCLPRFVIFPKVIFLNKTAFMIPCSAGLLVGDIIGYSRNTNSSSLKLINSCELEFKFLVGAQLLESSEYISFSQTIFHWCKREGHVMKTYSIFHE